MMKSLNLEEENIIKYVRNIFTLEKNEEIKDRIFSDIRNLFILKKENKTMKHILLRSYLDMILRN